jgi:hypothetical protein
MTLAPQWSAYHTHVSMLHLCLPIPSMLQAHVFRSPSGCAAFLANYNYNAYAKVVFNNEHYNLPPWSISILPDCKNVVYNTATVSFILLASVWHVVLPCLPLPLFVSELYGGVGLPD